MGGVDPKGGDDHPLGDAQVHRGEAQPGAQPLAVGHLPGGLKRFRAYTSHRFHGKSVKQRRQLRKASMVSKGDFKRIRRMVATMK